MAHTATVDRARAGGGCYLTAFMLRDKNLIPLSHQHQRALALCVRIDRAQPIPASDLEAWQAEVAQHFEHEVKIHFAAEEHALFPAAERFLELVPLIEELLSDHIRLRHWFSQAEARRISAADLPVFAQHLSAHIRKEERQLFERMQNLMSEEELAVLGRELNQALKDAEQACVVPTAATKLRPAK
jgi:hemerythrin-like domain-containing protein